MFFGLYLFILLSLEAGKLNKNVVLCYDDIKMVEAMERAVWYRKNDTEKTMLANVGKFIANHKFFSQDPRTGVVSE